MICYGCQRVCLQGDASIIKAVGNVYHQQCFQCSFCHISVLNKFYTLDDYTIVCEKDYYKHVQFNCRHCKKQITNDYFELIGDYKYHKCCLYCPDCITTHQDDLERFEYDGKPYCRFHYSLLNDTACVGCRQTILYHYKLKNGLKWHPECYMIKKYWDIELSLFQSVHCENKEQLIQIQDELLVKRERIWNVASQFQDSLFNILSSIIQYYKLSDSKKEYQFCHYLLQYIFTLFHILDEQSTCLDHEDHVKSTSNDIILFLDKLCQPNILNGMDNIVNQLSNDITYLLKLTLQQTIILERKETLMMDSVLNRLSNPVILESQFRSSNIQERVHVIQMAFIRLGIVLKSSPIQEFPSSSMEDRLRKVFTQQSRKSQASQRHYSLHIASFLPELSKQHDHMIRHLSLLYLNNMDESIMEELLDFKRDSLWGKLKTHILDTNNLSPPASMNFENKKIIGVSLSNLSSGSLSQRSSISSVSFERWASLCPSIQACFSANSLIPTFLRDCILVIIDQDMNTEGLFRKNGNIRGIRDICETIDSLPDRDDWIDYFKELPNIQLAAFVKKFLRELPEPLLTKRLYKLFMLSNRATHSAVAMIHYTMCLLPKQNRDILLVILALLNWVAKHSERNKMDYENLARVIAPTILYHQEENEVSNCHGEINVVSLMIEHFERLVVVPAKLTELIKNSTLLDYVQANAIDFTSTKQFIRHYRQLLKIKRDLNSDLLSPTC